MLWKENHEYEHFRDAFQYHQEMSFGEAHLRPALVSDARSIALVHVESSRSTYQGILPAAHLAQFTLEKRERFWAEMLRRPKPQTVTLVGFDPDFGILGFVSGGQERTGQLVCDGELYMIYLLPRAQGQGLGTLLTRRFVHELSGQGFRSLAVWVLAANPFRRFYEKLGGQIIAEQSIRCGEQAFVEVAYGWKDLSQFSGSR
ncbi:MAG: GNAT family N-acetyltransferase [Acidobacteriaceae bacterium]|nr:GNAT family N-acetyltransferase [Acidobacteriaceae bacterium]